MRGNNVFYFASSQNCRYAIIGGPFSLYALLRPRRIICVVEVVTMYFILHRRKIVAMQLLGGLLANIRTST